jgi:hypothetical protein
MSLRLHRLAEVEKNSFCGQYLPLGHIGGVFLRQQLSTELSKATIRLKVELNGLNHLR